MPHDRQPQGGPSSCCGPHGRRSSPGQLTRSSPAGTNFLLSQNAATLLTIVNFTLIKYTKRTKPAPAMCEGTHRHRRERRDARPMDIALLPPPRRPLGMACRHDRRRRLGRVGDGKSAARVACHHPLEAIPEAARNACRLRQADGPARVPLPCGHLFLRRSFHAGEKHSYVLEFSETVALEHKGLVHVKTRDTPLSLKF